MKTAAIQKLRQNLKADQPTCGLWVTLESPSITEMAVALAELDLARARSHRRQFDPVGHYARPDVFELRVDRRPKAPTTFLD